jgi:histidinol-phosphate aminotransferase
VSEVGYAVAPEQLVDQLNASNDAYPLARPSQAAALATLEHEGELERRLIELKRWTKELARGLEELGVRTYPTDTYFFLADFSPLDAEVIARALRERSILAKPLGYARLGPGFMRMTTALAEENALVLGAIEEALAATGSRAAARHPQRK